MQIDPVPLAVRLTLRRRMSGGSYWRLNLGQAFRPTWKLIIEKPSGRVWDLTAVRMRQAERRLVW
jgi:hypothetical protein